MTRLEAAGAHKIGGPFEISNKTTKIVYVANRTPPKNKIRQKTRQETLEERRVLRSRRRRHRTSRTMTRIFDCDAQYQVCPIRLEMGPSDPTLIEFGDLINQRTSASPKPDCVNFALLSALKM